MQRRIDMNSFSETVSFTDNLKYDTNAKRILANKQVLARILKKTVSELRDMSFPEIMKCIEGEPEISTVPVHPGLTNSPTITGMQNEDNIPFEGIVYYDIRFYVKVPQDNKIVKIIVNVEAQKSFYPGYHLETRGIVYGARLISAQLDTEFVAPYYDQLKKVYSIWICFDSSKEQANAISEYKITKHDIIPGIRDNQKAYDKLSVVLITLNSAIKSDDQFIAMLNCLFDEDNRVQKKDLLSSQYGYEITDDFGKELDIMCNLSEALVEKGIEKGEKRLQTLLNYLIKAGRYSELEAITAGDEKLKQHLYKEFNL